MDFFELRQQLQTLKIVAHEYKGKTIDNIIQQMEDRLSIMSEIKLKGVIQ